MLLMVGAIVLAIKERANDAIAATYVLLSVHCRNRPVRR